MIDLFLRQYFVAFIVENRQTKKDGRAERYVIETDHQLELEFPSILNSTDKLQRELFIYFASNVNWLFFYNSHLEKESRRYLNRKNANRI